MQYKLTNGKEYTIDNKSFARIAHFKAFFPNGEMEFIDSVDRRYYISETQENRFMVYLTIWYELLQGV